MAQILEKQVKPYLTDGFHMEKDLVTGWGLRYTMTVFFNTNELGNETAKRMTHGFKIREALD